MNIKEYLQQHPQWKKRIHGFIMHPVKTRPYWWIRVWQPFYIKKGRGSVIYPSVRKDLPPFHLFQMGKYSVVEDFSCLNNAVGDIIIGDYCRIGLSNTVIGPIRIDNGVNISQNVVLIGRCFYCVYALMCVSMRSMPYCCSPVLFANNSTPT